MSDAKLLTLIVAFLIFANSVAVIVAQDLGEDASSFDTDSIESNLEGARESVDTSTGWTILRFISGVFIFSFGLIPLWIDLLIFVFVRIPGYILLARLLRGV